MNKYNDLSTQVKLYKQNLLITTENHFDSLHWVEPVGSFFLTQCFFSFELQSFER